MLKRKNKGAGGISDDYSKNNGAFHAKSHRSSYVSEVVKDGKLDRELNKKITENIRTAKKKEIELYNQVGPSSTPERHYPKSFTITKKEDKNNDK